MRNAFLLIVLLIVNITAIGQKRIENSLTEDHQQIKGTKISIIPPKGFLDAPNFSGFQQTESGSSIMVLDIPGPYSETSKGITKENLLSKGVEVSKLQKLTINGLPATFVTGTQNAYGNIYTKYIFIFGSENETIIINGAAPENLKNLVKEVKNSILSAHYEAAKKIDPFENIDYTISVADTKLIFAKSMSNSLLFTVDGKVPTSSEDKTNLIVAKSFSPVMKEDRKLFVLNRLKQLPFSIENIAFTEEISIDGVSGYEVYATGKSKTSEEQEFIYQVILFSDDLYYIFLGTSNDDSEKSLALFQQVVGTFERK